MATSAKRFNVGASPTYPSNFEVIMTVFDKLEMIGIKLERISDTMAMVLYPDGQKQVISDNTDPHEFHRSYVKQWVWGKTE